MLAAGDVDKSHGARVRYANPSTGGPVLPTMGANLAMLPKGFKGEPYRATDGTVFVCVEGRGTTNVDGHVLEWGPRDVFVVPSWKRYPTLRRSNRCCSRFPIARRRKRSVSGARGSDTPSFRAAQRAVPGIHNQGLTGKSTAASTDPRLQRIWIPGPRAKARVPQ